MTMLVCLSIALFVAVLANDFLLAMRVRKSVGLQRLDCPELGEVRSGGSLLGIAVNLWRLRTIPAYNELSDPDHIAIGRQYRAQQLLVALLIVCVVALFCSL
jgi:hypothetical protein